MTVTIATKEVKNLNDVKSFFKELLEKNINFHPDDPFGEIVWFEAGKKSKPIFTKKEADRLDLLMSDCFDVCEEKNKNIYDIALRVFQKQNAKK